MPDPTPTTEEEMSDAEHAEIAALESTAAAMNDETLLEIFTGMLQPPPWEGTTAVTMGGASEKSAMVTRVLWCEVVKRWVPARAFADAMVNLFEDGVTDPGSEGEKFRDAVEAETADARMNRRLASPYSESERGDDVT